jgi:hypothetical protein
VGSKTFDGVRFAAFAADHLPRHVHGFVAEISVVVDLLPDGKVAKSARRDAVRPANAKRSDVRRILDAAAAHTVELNELWEAMHGQAS